MRFHRRRYEHLRSPFWRWFVATSWLVLAAAGLSGLTERDGESWGAGVAFSTVCLLIAWRGWAPRVSISEGMVTIHYMFRRLRVLGADIQHVYHRPYSGVWTLRSRSLRMPCLFLRDGSVVEIQPLTSCRRRARAFAERLAIETNSDLLVPAQFGSPPIDGGEI